MYLFPFLPLTHHSFVCRCPTNERTMPETRKASEEYQEKLTELVNSGKYDSDNDFTVVIQPFFVDAQLPRDAVSQHSDHFWVHCIKSLKFWKCFMASETMTCAHSHTRMGIQTNPTLLRIASTSARRDTEMQLLPSGTTWWDAHTHTHTPKWPNSSHWNQITTCVFSVH